MVSPRTERALMIAVIGGFFFVIIAGFLYYTLNSPFIVQHPASSRRITIERVEIAENAIHVKNTGSVKTTINSCVIKDSNGVVAFTEDIENITMEVGATENIILKTAFSTLPFGTYTVTLVTAEGGNFISPAFTVP